MLASMSQGGNLIHVTHYITNFVILQVATSDETMDHMGIKGLIAPLRAFG